MVRAVMGGSSVAFVEQHFVVVVGLFHHVYRD
jgi:hypothetical protein